VTRRMKKAKGEDVKRFIVRDASSRRPIGSVSAWTYKSARVQAKRAYGAEITLDPAEGRT